MSADHEKQDELQRVLALKRREAPPPRFFTGFSHKVIDRLHAPADPEPRTWWQRVGFDPENKPLMVCVSGVIVCGLLGIGFVASYRIDRTKGVPRNMDRQSQFVVAPPVNALTPPPATENAPASVNTGAIPPVGTPVVISESSPFGPNRVQPARATVNGPGQ